MSCDQHSQWGLWHPGPERPVYLTLPAQRSCLLAMLNILIQKQPLHLWYKRVQQLQVTNYCEAWRHGVCGNTMYIIYVTTRASIRRSTLRQRNDEVMELHSTGTLLGHGLVCEVRHNQLSGCSFSCIWHDTPGQYIECTCKHTIVKT